VLFVYHDIRNREKRHLQSIGSLSRTLGVLSLGRPTLSRPTMDAAAYRDDATEAGQDRLLDYVLVLGYEI
jgi:hypothetical protein